MCKSTTKSDTQDIKMGFLFEATQSALCVLGFRLTHAFFPRTTRNLPRYEIDEFGSPPIRFSE